MRSGTTLALAAGLVVACSSRAAAQGGIFEGMQKGIQTVFSSSATTITFASGAVSKTGTTNLYPALTFNLSGLVFPSLRLDAGGVFEINLLSTTVDGEKTRSTLGRNRPHVALRSTNPVFAPGVSFSRREDRARTIGLSNVKLVNDEYGATLDWNVEGGPRSQVQLIKTHTFDGAKAQQDTEQTFGSVLSRYAGPNLSVAYRGTYVDTRDRLRSFESRQLSNAIRADYSGTFIAQRLQWNTTYNIARQDVRAISIGSSGDIFIPVTPFAGLSATSDTPITAKLSQNPILVDGNLTAVAGVDLGLPTSAADGQARNVGFDFLTPTDVSRVFVWVDRSLPVEISNSFSWDVYSSTDNILWNRESTVTMTPFGPFENRFQIDFPTVTARYLKLVTAPLSPAAPNASQFQDIFVTEIQAFVRRQPGAATTVSQTLRQLNTDVRMRMLDAASLYLELSYLSNSPGRGRTRIDTWSNGVSASRAFGRWLSLFGRGALEQGHQADGFRIATLTNAALTLEPMPTLRSSLLYSGQDERIGGSKLFQRSVIVQNSARPYRGVDLLVGYGRSFITQSTGVVAHGRLLNLNATVVPRPHVSVTTSYDESTTVRTGTFIGAPVSSTRRASALVALDPMRTLHAVVGGEWSAVTGQPDRTAVDFGISWAPFPDGTLQLMFTSNGSLRTLEYGRDRNTIAAVRWNLSHRSYIDVAFQKTRSELAFQTMDQRIFSITARVFP